MADKGRVRWPWLVLAVVATALVACAVGAVIGGAAGYAVGRRAGGELPLRTLPGQNWRAPTPAPTLPGRPMQFGALVASVVAASPAEEAGLQAGDVISAVDGIALSQVESLAEVIGAHKPGDAVTLSVTRSGDSLDLGATLGRNADKGGQVPWLGVEFRTVPLGLGPDLQIMPGTH